MIKDKQKWNEFIRFCIVGTLAAGVHYGIYYLLQYWINVNIAYTIGYIISFIGNFFLTSYLTFRIAPSFKRAIGFGGSHLVNYGIHMALLNLFLYLNLSKEIAPLLALTVAVPINFILLRWIFKRGAEQAKKSVETE